MMAMNNEKDNGFRSFSGDDQADFEDEEADFGPEEMEDNASVILAIAFCMLTAPLQSPLHLNRASPDIHRLPSLVPSRHTESSTSAAADNA